MEKTKQSGTCLVTTGSRHSRTYSQCIQVLRSLSGQTTGKSSRSLVVCSEANVQRYMELLRSLIRTEPFKHLSVEIYSISSLTQLLPIKDSRSQIVICASTSLSTGVTSSSSNQWTEFMETYQSSRTSASIISWLLNRR